MSKVTSKLQVTIPRRIADQFAIQPGDEIEFLPAGDGLRVATKAHPRAARLSVAERLRLFDEATTRQQRRQAAMQLPGTPPADRGWTRDELYSRGKPG